MLVSGAPFQYIYIDEQNAEVFFTPHLHRGDFFSVRLQQFKASASDKVL